MKEPDTAQEIADSAMRLIEKALDSQLQGTCKRKNMALLQAAHATLQELKDFLKDSSVE